MKYKIKTEFNACGNQVIEAKSPQDAYKKACEKVFKTNQDNADNNKNKKIRLSDTDKFFYERPKSDVLIIDENDNIFCADGRRYEEYLEENYNLYESDYIDNKNIGSLHFIWGVKSPSDTSEELKASFDTTNDIDIVYNSDTKMYILSFEELHHFQGRSELIKYLDNLLCELKKYMSEKGYETEELKKTNECSIFEKSNPTIVLREMSSLEAKTLLDLFYKFKLFISCYKKITQN